MSQQNQVIFNGRYELHRRLGRGGMAEVYLARDQLLDRPVAVKVLFPALATDPGFVERFRREAQSAANLQHPNIVSVFDWGEANGTYFIVMEYVEGMTLAEVLRDEGRLHPDRAAEITADIAAALGFAHRNRVVHRDVKPGNVLITRDGGVKVADFGIARALSDSSDQNLTKTGSVMGTATYFSPEQARGAPVDPRSDIYSLGCVLYEMTTGHPPFAGDSAVAIAYKHVQENPMPPRRFDPALPETLEAITLKCLAKNPANRYPTAQDLRADLRRFLDGNRIMAEPVLAPPTDPGATNLMTRTQYGDQTAAMTGPRRYDDDHDYEGYGDYDDAEEEEQPKRSRWVLAALILLLVVLAGLLVFLARNAGGDDDVRQVTVPGVEGQEVTAATAVLEKEGLVVTTELTNDPQVPANQVISQDPGAGKEVDEGSTVKLTVSQGPKAVAVPDVTGMTQTEAQQTLTAQGFVVDVTPQESDEVEEGRVISQDPAANQQVPPGATIALAVSSGKGKIAVPDVRNQSVGTARANLDAAGFSSITERQQPSDAVPAGTVMAVDPTPGTEVVPDQTITLTVSSGVEKVSVPNVEGLDEANARTQLEGVGLRVSVKEQVEANPARDGLVISQSPSARQEVDSGSTVTIVVARLVDSPGAG
ncbi:MAG TPA: Stk1 family PASTA domain-containing Ser/Thr kinase [Acidimicrobiales bacterium]|nr:Stk1 family PASTA domain-containing Ser/Thr kinase [Acidimicrobiales bacterium]